MPSQKLINELNQQIKDEFFSAQYYLAMAAFCAEKSLDGFANFFVVQAEEERFHAMKFFNYLLELGEKPVITGFEDPQTDFGSLEDVFVKALEHEKFVTGRIYTILDAAHEDKHYATINFLQWFVEEQVEEEASMDSILEKIKLIGEKGQGIYMLDKEMSQRTFTPPSTA